MALPATRRQGILPGSAPDRNARYGLLHPVHPAFTTISALLNQRRPNSGTSIPMVDTDSALELARRQAAQARTQVQRQQTIVDALVRQGCEAVRARRVLGELRLAAELLQDRVLHLEDCMKRCPVITIEQAARAEGRLPAEVAPG